MGYAKYLEDSLRRYSDDIFSEDKSGSNSEIIAQINRNHSPLQSVIAPAGDGRKVLSASPRIDLIMRKKNTLLTKEREIRLEFESIRVRLTEIPDELEKIRDEIAKLNKIIVYR